MSRDDDVHPDDDTGSDDVGGAKDEEAQEAEEADAASADLAGSEDAESHKGEADLSLVRAYAEEREPWPIEEGAEHAAGQRRRWPGQGERQGQVTLRRLRNTNESPAKRGSRFVANRAV